MCTATRSVKLLVATYAAFCCVVCLPCGATDDQNLTIQDCASSCGNIHNIRYPFRLKTDPKHCGNKIYELACEDHAVILYLNVRRTGQVIGCPVQAINYNNLTIRLADPNAHMDSSYYYNNCILPGPVMDSSYYSTGYRPWLYSSDYEETYRSLMLISCAYPVAGLLDVYNSACNNVAADNSKSFFNLRRYWYVKVGPMNSSDLDNSCRIESMFVTSLLPGKANNISYIDVKNSFAYGFELSWERLCCASEVSRKYNCSRVLEVSYCNRFTVADYSYGVLGLILYAFVTYKVLVCFCGSPCVTIFLIYKWRRRHLSAYDDVEKFLQSDNNNLVPIRYSYSEIKKMTKGFKERLGEGGYGSVYKGKLRSGNFAAIKMLDKPKANGQEFINEVATIGRIHHANVVQLVGFSVEGSKRALVYEFMANGSLDKHIFSKEGCISLSNKMIYDISLGVAHGIEYLHQGCDMQILHFDIKPHNILLNEDFLPKISDFGLAKLHSTDNSIVSLTARGTMGYIAPEFFYKNIGNISHKADVYSFGMLLMEMVGRRKNINASTEHLSRIYFPSWIYDQFNEGRHVKLGDETEEESKTIKKMVIVALWCIQLNPANRPSMHKVIEMLEREVELLQMPPKPLLAPQKTPINDAGLNMNSEISSTYASSEHSDTISLLINAH